MVADAMAPAGEPRLLADVAFAQFAAGMGAIAVHESSLDAARKGTCTASLVKNCNAIMAPRSTGPATEASDARSHPPRATASRRPRRRRPRRGRAAAPPARRLLCSSERELGISGIARR